MSKKRPTPELVKIDGKWYQLTVMLIHTKDVKKRPKLATCIHDEETIDLNEGEEFMTVYIPRVMMKGE